MSWSFSKAPSSSTLVVTLWLQELTTLWGSSQFTAGASDVWLVVGMLSVLQGDILARYCLCPKIPDGSCVTLW